MPLQVPKAVISLTDANGVLTEVIIEGKYAVYRLPYPDVHAGRCVDASAGHDEALSITYAAKTAHSGRFSTKCAPSPITEAEKAPPATDEVASDAYYHLGLLVAANKHLKALHASFSRDYTSATVQLASAQRIIGDMDATRRSDNQEIEDLSKQVRSLEQIIKDLAKEKSVLEQRLVPGLALEAALGGPTQPFAELYEAMENFRREYPRPASPCNTVPATPEQTAATGGSAVV